MRHVLIVKAAQHMNDGVAFTYVAQELVAQTLALAGTFYQTGYIHNLNGGGNYPARMNQLGQFGESLIRYGYCTYVGFDSAERKVCRLRLGA